MFLVTFPGIEKRRRTMTRNRKEQLLALVILSLGACQSTSVKIETGQVSGKNKSPCVYDLLHAARLDEENIQHAYDCAVEDASKTESSEISNSLHPITSREDLVVAHWARLPPKDGNDAFRAGNHFRPNWDIWVTLVPDFQNFCTSLPSDIKDTEKLTLRLEQLLGLPPNNGKIRIVHMRVHPSDLFRPCPDPEVTDTHCELKYPDDVTPDHRVWLDKVRSNTYSPPKAYPFTALGYTYDWGNLETKVGLSEYLIKQDSEVIVESVATTEEYCHSKAH
jgi:hypothetical protein